MATSDIYECGFDEDVDILIEDNDEETAKDLAEAVKEEGFLGGNATLLNVQDAVER